MSALYSCAFRTVVRFPRPYSIDGFLPADSWGVVCSRRSQSSLGLRPVYQCVDVFGAPDRDALTKAAHGLWVTTILHPLPPGAFGHGDDGGYWRRRFGVADDLRQT